MKFHISEYCFFRKIKVIGEPLFLIWLNNNFINPFEGVVCLFFIICRLIKNHTTNITKNLQKFNQKSDYFIDFQLFLPKKVIEIFGYIKNFY